VRPLLEPATRRRLTSLQADPESSPRQAERRAAEERQRATGPIVPERPDIEELAAPAYVRKR